MVQGGSVESAVRRYASEGVRWSAQGMLRLSPEAMRQLFLPTLAGIRQAIGDVLNAPSVKGCPPLTPCHTLDSVSHP